MSTLMPHAADAEKILLGSLITYPKQIETVLEMDLRPHHFYVKNHEVLYSEMIQLFRQKGYIDIGLLTQFLIDDQKYDQLGGVDFLATVTASATTSSNVSYYASLVMDKYQLRQLIESTQEIAKDAQSSREINEILDSAEKSILDITRDRRAGDFQFGGDVAQQVADRLRDLEAGKLKNRGMKTGYDDLDFRTNGFQPGDLIILAARPSVGKTAFALNLAANAAMIQKDKSIAIFSLEMPASQLMTRMLSARTLIPSNHFKTGKNMSTHLWNTLQKAIIDFKQVKIYIDDSSSTKMSDIVSKCRKLKNDENLGMIVIDYIQLINSTDFSDNRQQQVSLISRQLKSLARELDVPVIALSQLSRLSVQGQKQRRPILSDIRESGSIEQDADVVMMLYRELYGKYGEGEEEEIQQNPNDPQEIEVILAKHRNGSTGTVKLMFVPEISRFNDIKVVQ